MPNLINYTDKFPQICLGTAQFGSAYGITNTIGKVPLAEVDKILSLAIQNNIYWLDTAQKYGTSEVVLGKCMKPRYNFRVISKLSPQKNSFFTKDDVSLWEESLHKTLKNLDKNHIDTLMIHSSSDLRKPGSDLLYGWLDSIRLAGLIKRVGLSIYNAKDLTGINHSILDIVQLPMSLFDQRLLIDGTIEMLVSQGIKIHARSIYLQGLLLTPSTLWPSWVDKYGLNHKLRLEHLCEEKGCSEIDLALSFIKSQSFLEAVVVGICDTQQLHDLLESWSLKSPWIDNEWKSWAISRSNILDPRKWPK